MNNKTKGIFCIILSAFSFSLMNMFVKLAGDLPSIEKAFFRNIVAVIFALILIKKDHISLKPEKGSFPFLFMRAAFGTVGLICNFYSVDHLVQSDASMLNKMAPFFVMEKLTVFQSLTVVFAFIGCLFIVKPSLSNMALFPSVIGLIGGLGAGAAYTCVRHLGQKGVKAPYIVFFFSAFSSLVTLPLMILDFKPMTLFQFFMLMLTGLSAASGQFFVTSAYSFAPGKEISVYDYSQVIFSAILGFIIFNQIPDKYSFIGYIIIIAMAVSMFFHSKSHEVLNKIS